MHSLLLLQSLQLWKNLLQWNAKVRRIDPWRWQRNIYNGRSGHLEGPMVLQRQRTRVHRHIIRIEIKETILHHHNVRPFGWSGAKVKQMIYYSIWFHGKDVFYFFNIKWWTGSMKDSFWTPSIQQTKALDGG